MILICRPNSLTTQTYQPLATRDYDWGPAGSFADLTDRTISYNRTIVLPSIATREIYTMWQDSQEQESALCAINGFAVVSSAFKANCDNAFIEDYPSINSMTHCLPEFRVSSQDKVLWGFFGMGSEPDFNTVRAGGPTRGGGGGGVRGGSLAAASKQSLLPAS